MSDYEEFPTEIEQAQLPKEESENSDFSDTKTDDITNADSSDEVTSEESVQESEVKPYHTLRVSSLYKSFGKKRVVNSFIGC